MSDDKFVGGFNSDTKQLENDFPAPALDSKQEKEKEAHVAIDVNEPLADSEAGPSSKGDKHEDFDATRGPPPAFAPYEAEFFETDDGDIISHDHHLNEDGEALYRFLLSHSERRPNYTVTLHGTHTERRTRTVWRTVNGRQTAHTETYTVTVTDFQFSFDLTHYIAVGPEHYTYPDDKATFRGLMVKQVMMPQGLKRKATKEEKYADEMDRQEHEQRGVPPWMDMNGNQRWRRDASSWTLRQWADDYASSKKILKEFVYTKKVYGWNTSELEAAMRTVIVQTGYTGHTDIHFSLNSKRICIRPDNRLSRTLSRTLYKVLLIIFLVYPFIWLFKRFSKYGGGRWKVAGGMYALKVYVPVMEGEAYLDGLISGDQAQVPTLAPRLVRDENGALKKLTGYREGEWFRTWEKVIRNATEQRVRRSEPFTSVEEGPSAGVGPGAGLDGY
ncbi:hypothetical protein CPB83DRAFT_779432 [Crepidotus variabilis]|uniref:Uncharacterized protein n=1 Tax=Crepidotus variabilis TaxID=179855 RepID=A0A9P6EVE1_9AGAR|nr:hypothetical protein CPB83DRAFT_779432 [Crepidotus variabilis]